MPIALFGRTETDSPTPTSDQRPGAPRAAATSVGLGVVVSLGAFLCAGPQVSAQDIASFNPNDYITPGQLPTAAEVAALDAAAQTAGFLIEGFEDGTYLPGLTITPAIGSSGGNCGDVGLIAEAASVWDGGTALASNLVLVPEVPISIQYAPGAEAVALGISGTNSDNELLVNGVNYGPITSLANFEPNLPGQNSRNIFVQIAREAGGDPITEVQLLPDPTAPNPAGDCVRIDHLAILPLAPECLLVIGDAPGDATHFDIEHLFQTQVGPTIEDVHTVLMTDIPEFVLPGPGLRVVPTGMGMLGTGPSAPVAPSTEIPSWMWDGRFTVQVLMWNPSVFPAQPEQYSYGLGVHVRPDGSVTIRPFGTAVGGVEIWHELDTNAQGQKVIRFPFSISGL